MFTVSRMPMIRPGLHGLMHVKQDLGTLATAKPTKLGS